MTEQTAGAIAARIAANIDAFKISQHKKVLDPAVISKPHVDREVGFMIAAFTMIERKAELMRLDARARGQQITASDADEIRLLAQIALRNAGVDGNE